MFIKLPHYSMLCSLKHKVYVSGSHTAQRPSACHLCHKPSLAILAFLWILGIVSFMSWFLEVQLSPPLMRHWDAPGRAAQNLQGASWLQCSPPPGWGSGLVSARLSPWRRRRQWKRNGLSSLMWRGQPKRGARLSCGKILKVAFYLSEVPLPYSSFSNLFHTMVFPPNRVSQVCPTLFGHLF